MDKTEGKSGLKIGFLGGGRMAQALSSGFIMAGLAKAEDMIVSDPIEACRLKIQESGLQATSSNIEVVQRSQVLILAIKPHILPDVLREVHDIVTTSHLFISIVAGAKIEFMQQMLPEGARLIRTMPNTPALVHCGATAFTPGVHATQEDEELTRQLFSSIGICERLPENLLDSITGLSGSGPAYCYLMLEAMADGGVKMGLPRDVAQKFAAQTLMGAAKMVLQTGRHPGSLKDDVCSPGGTTIAGVHELERGGFRGTVISTVEAATKRSRELGSQ